MDSSSIVTFIWVIEMVGSFKLEMRGAEEQKGEKRVHFLEKDQLKIDWGLLMHWWKPKKKEPRHGLV